MQEPTDDKNVLERERELKELKEIRFDIELTIALMIFHSNIICRGNWSPPQVVEKAIPVEEKVKPSATVK